ncbi:hypothetical protein [Alicyclobacillus ferrooxydans]|uniref:hypothetical protein n=1 Tax=Alicyclobacillus ferrooxydans TaxID=471514 RepID=UPI0012ECFFC3|nr:hypothetical protein [Alicyclobacillus ferrooxydans]
MAQIRLARIHGFEVDDHGERHQNTMTISLRELVEYNTPYYDLLFSKLGELAGA